MVTGGAGGLGRAIAERLLADGHRVTVLDVASPDGTRTDRAQIEMALISLFLYLPVKEHLPAHHEDPTPA